MKTFTTYLGFKFRIYYWKWFNISETYSLMTGDTYGWYKVNVWLVQSKLTGHFWILNLHTESFNQYLSATSSKERQSCCGLDNMTIWSALGMDITCEGGPLSIIHCWKSGFTISSSSQIIYTRSTFPNLPSVSNPSFAKSSLNTFDRFTNNFPNSTSCSQFYGFQH